MNQTNKFTGIEICVALAIAGIVVAQIASAPWGAEKDTKYKTPPPGWEIVTDGNGNWGAKFPGGYFVIEHGLRRNPLASEQEAIDRAWAQYDYEQEKLKESARRGPEPVREWRKP